MHTDARTLNDDSLLEGDICIVGAGAAGISMALEFVHTNKKVLLLESGGFEYDADMQALNNGDSIGQRYFPLQTIRLRYFGGTTNHWAGWCSPLDPIDFEERDWVPYSGWPFAKKDLNPYYDRAQQVCELGPYPYDLDFWEQKQPEAFRFPFDKTKVTTKMWQKSPPTRFGRRYREAIVKAAQVHLYTFANLTNIELNAAGRKVKGLEVKCPNGKRHRVKARQYVLACGAIENVRYLLSSNAVMKTGIGNQHDLVGRFFMEHPHVDSGHMMVAGEKNMDLYYTSFFTSQQFGLLALAEEYQRQEKLLNYSVHLIPTTIDAKRFNVFDVIGEDAKLVLDFMNRIDQAIKEGRKDQRLKTAFYLFSTRIEQAPNPDSRVVLADTTDRYGTRHVKLNWQLSELDKLTILKANLVIGKELGRLGLGRLRLDDWLLQQDPPWPDNMGGGPHNMGVTRMSKDPAKGVVDENCRVHGLPNLFIASASVFPTSGSANPTLTIVALAIRLSDHLKTLD